MTIWLCLCVHLWGKFSLTWQQQRLWHPQLHVHLHNLASQCCSMKKRGCMGGWRGHKVGYGVLGGGHSGIGTDGSSGLSLFWVDSWKQTHITQKSAIVFLDLLVAFVWLLLLFVFVFFVFFLYFLKVSGSNVQGGRTMCHSLALASRSDIITKVLRYFLFLFTDFYIEHMKKSTSEH